MGYYEDYLEDKKKREQALKSKEQGGTNDKFYQAYLEDKKKLGYEVPKPSQVAKQEVMPTKVEEKKPSLFEKIKTKAGEVLSGLSGKKKIEEQLAKVQEQPEIKIDTTQIQQPIKLQDNIFDELIAKEKTQSAQLSPQGQAIADKISEPVAKELARLEAKKQSQEQLDWRDKIYEVATNPEDLVAFVKDAKSVKTTVDLLQAANRLKAGKHTKEDLLVLQDYMDQQNRDQSFGYKVLNVVTGAIPFAQELYLTSGLSILGKKAATKGLTYLGTKAGKEVLEKEFTKFGLKKIAVNVAGRTLQTIPAGAVKITSDTLKRQVDSTLTTDKIEDKESWGKSITVSFLDRWVETVSEFSGGALDDGIKALVTSKAGKQLMSKATATAMYKTLSKINLPKMSPAITKLFSEVGYDGVLNEMFEERVGEATRGFLNKFGLSEEEWKIPSKEQLAVEFVSFLVPGVTGQVISTAMLNRIKPIVLTPEATQETVNISNLAGTEAGEALTKMAGRAEEENKTIVVDTTGRKGEVFVNTPQGNSIGIGLGEEIVKPETPMLTEEEEKEVKQVKKEPIVTEKKKETSPEPLGQTQKKEVVPEEVAKQEQKIEPVKLEGKTPQERVGEIYRHILETAESKSPYVKPEQWKEDMIEEAKGDRVEEAKNPKGIVIGDIVNVKEKDGREYEAYVVGVQDESNAPAYEGGFSVKVVQPGKFPGYVQINDVNKVGEEKKPGEKEDKKEESKPKKKITVKKFDLIPRKEGGYEATRPETLEPITEAEPTSVTADGIWGRMNDSEKAGAKMGLFPKWMKDEMDKISTEADWQRNIVNDLMRLAEKGIIPVDETATVQPTGVSDTGEVRQPADRERNPEIDERSLHDETTSDGQLGVGPKPDRARIGKVGRASINERAVNILEGHSYSTDAKEYKEEELEVLRQYSGAGGKEVAGATGKGLLSEYYTPPEVVDKVWELARALAPNAKRALEPSMGTGNLIFDDSFIDWEGYEYQKVSGTIAKLLHQDTEVMIGNGEEFGNNGNFETHISAPEYDMVVGNPPFGERASFLKGKGEEPKINRWEDYFIKKGLDSLKQGGKLIYVVNSSFLNKESSYAKEEIAKIGRLVQAYRLPEGIFADTNIGTDIVVFEKTPVLSEKGGSNDRLEIQKRIVDITSGNYFDKNPDNIAGTQETRQNRFGVWESYIKGTIDDVRRLSIVVETPETEEVSAPVKTPKVKPIREPSYSIKVLKRAKSTSAKEKFPAIIKPDKKKVETVPVQTISGSVVVADPIEAKILKETKVDGSVDYISEAKKVLNYHQGKYYHDVNYFSGDIYQKIEDLKGDKETIISKLGQAQYDKQLKGLENIKPKPVELKDITFDPLDRYVTEIKVDEESGVKLIDQFISFLNKTDSALSYGVSRWDVRNYVMGFRASPGTKNIMGAIKADSARLFNYFVRNVLSNDIQEQIVDKFNREKNSYVNPDYSKIPTEIKNMAKYFRNKIFKLSKTQANGVSFLTNKGVGLVAYGVGVGKTHTILTATMVAKQRGWTKRPAFIVPKSTLSQTWIATIKSMFPNDTIVNLGGLTKPDVTRLEKERGKDKKKWIKDGEVAVLTHEGLLRLALTPEEMKDAVGDLKDALMSKAETERQRAKEEEKVTEIVGKAQYKAGDINISDLGIDHISVDEVHNFRKVFQGAKPEAVLPDGTVDKSKTKRFANVIGGTPSKQAQQLFLISQYILKKNNNRGVYLASATPFENHATEVYNILSFVARDRLKKIGIYNINDFFALFSNFETEMEKNVRGEWVNKEKMKSFKNLPQLQKILREFVDYQVDPTLVRPERKVLTPTLQMSTLQEENLTKIQEMLKPSEGRKPEDGAVLKASTYSVANSISPYFIKEYHPEIVSPEELIDNSPKLKYSMELVRWLKNNEATKNYGTFMYMGANGVEYHNHIADYAVKHLGFKPKEVAVINGATSNDEREAIKNEFNEGIVKLLIGGDPTKEGIDLQNNGYVTINNALGWNPTEPAQVEGRVWRQGNKRSIAPLIYPLVENSGDITVYNKFEEKGSRINDLFSYQGQIFDVGELDPREKKLALMTNPEDKAAIEIEMDKAGLQNQLMMYSTDIGNYKRIQDRIASLNDSIAFNQERIVTGKTQWGSPIEPEGISNYRKELNKQKKELASIQEKLDKAGITDIDAEIKRIEGLKETVNIDIGKITETYKDRLAKFQREYDEMIANRKSIDNHVQDFVSSTKDLRELDQEEIDTKKEQLMKDLELKQIQEGQRYKAPGGMADTGGYADLEASGVVLKNIRAIEFPEMVSLVRELTGDVPKLKAFKRALGRMYETGEGAIKLNPNIFDNPVVAGKVLAHEIGHLADFIPDGFTTRGNLIGHIASLSKFMQAKYGDLVNKEVKNELKNLTQLWKPFDETVNANYTKYRYSAKELYADAVSVLLNDPGLLQKVAPQFYDGFFTFINEKPKYEQAYFDTLELLDKGEEAVNNKRLEEIYEGFKEAREKREKIETEEKPVKPFFERLMRNHITKFDPIYRKLDKVDIGVVESSKQKVREALEEMQLRRNDQAIFLDKITTEITDALEKIGMSEEDLGVVLKLEREALGDRMNLANPGGLIGNIPEIVLSQYYKQKNLSEEQIKVFEQIKTRFHELIFAETERAVKNGNFNKKVFEEKIVPNKDTYATFSVVDYIHKNYIDAGIKKQVGTLKRIENPFTSSVLKTVALIDWNNIQEAKQVTVGELQQYFPDDVKEAKAIRTNKGTVIRFRKEDNLEVLEMMKDGRKVGYNVDPYIKEMFDSGYYTPDEIHQVVGISRWFNKAFKPLVTTYNLSWGFYSNIIRDTKRTYISLGAALNKFAPGKKGVSIGEMLTSFIKSLPEGAKFAAGQKTELIKEMLKNRALTTSWSQYDPNANNDSSIAFLLRQHKLIGKEEKVGAVRKVINNTVGKVLEGIKYAGGTFEATSKISGYQIAKKRISDGKRLGFIVRNYVGTPNYTEGGKWKQVDNDIFVFSNVMIQATRASVELATDPKTASGYWMRTFLIGVLPKLLMVMGLAGWWGEWVKKNFQSQTEYDKTNYITIPMGFDENGKAIYIRVPQDESERFISAIVWKTLSGLVQRKAVKPEQVLSIGAGYIPSVTPLWTAVGDWVGYFQGRNPYDSYRGRLAIDETSWKAGGLIRLKNMVQYSANTLGLSNFKTYDFGAKSTTEVVLDRIPILNRMFQTSNYGLQEQFSSSAEQEAARKSLRKREIVDKYVKLSRNITSEAELAALRTDMVREYFGGELPTDKDLISEGKALSKKFTIQRERGESPYMDKLIYSNTNAEKIDYLQQFQKVLPVGDFKKLVNDALKYKIISGNVVEELKKLDIQSGYGKEEPKKKGLLNFKLVKEAFAAEGIEDTYNKLTWSKDIRTGWEKFLGNIAKLIPGEQKYENPIEGIEYEKLNSGQRREYYQAMLALREENPDWYYQNIGNKVEKRILGHDLGEEKVVRELITKRKEEAKTTPTPTPEVKEENMGAGDTEPAPTISSPKGTETPHNDIIKEVFGDKWVEATKVLKRTDPDGVIRGENVGLKTGKEVDIPNRQENPDGSYNSNGKIKTYKNRYTGETEQSIDRGLFRINNKGLFEKGGKLGSPEFRANLIKMGVLDEKYQEYSNIDKEAIDTLWEKMLNVEDNVKMAKAIYDYNGWTGWYAAPEEWR